MRIIENPQKQKEEIDCCKKCGCKFAYTEEDVYSSYKGKYVTCPTCGEELNIGEFDHPLCFPESYFYFGKPKSVHIEPKEIEEWVKTGIKFCLNNNETYYFTGTGDSFVMINWYQNDDCFSITVGQNYYEQTISTQEAKDVINF